MADDKKKSDGGDGMSLGAMFLIGIGVLFVMWLTSGGPERLENKYNPFIEPPETPYDDFEVYGEGSTLQTGVEEFIQDGKYAGWKIQNRKDFAFLTPPNWTSSVKGNFGRTEFGEIQSETINLEYQYGRNVNKLEFENNPNYLVEYGTVDGEWTRFVKPKNNSVETTGAYIKKNRWRGMTIYTNQALTPEEQTQVFEIINTIKF